MLAARIISVEADSELVDDSGCHGPRPANSHPMSLQVLVTKIRGSGSISNPVESTGDEADPGGPTVADEDRVLRSRLPVDTLVVPVGVVCERLVREKIVDLACGVRG